MTTILFACVMCDILSFSHPPYCGPLPLISEKNFRFGAARQGHARKGNSNCSKAGLFFIIIILCIRKKSQMFTVKNWTGGKNTPFRPRGASRLTPRRKRRPLKIGTPRQSRGFFIDGQSPLILAGRVTSRKYGLPIARDCYLLPVNGFRRSPSSVVPRLCPRPTDV